MKRLWIPALIANSCNFRQFQGKYDWPLDSNDITFSDKSSARLYLGLQPPLFQGATKLHQLTRTFFFKIPFFGGDKEDKGSY